jgi:hypothetical protein
VLPATCELSGQRVACVCFVPDTEEPDAPEFLFQVLGCFATDTDADRYVRNVAAAHISEHDIDLVQAVRWVFPTADLKEVKHEYRSSELTSIMQEHASQPARVAQVRRELEAGGGGPPPGGERRPPPPARPVGRRPAARPRRPRLFCAPPARQAPEGAARMPRAPPAAGWWPAGADQPEEQLHRAWADGPAAGPALLAEAYFGRPALPGETGRVQTVADPLRATGRLRTGAAAIGPPGGAAALLPAPSLGRCQAGGAAPLAAAATQLVESQQMVGYYVDVDGTPVAEVWESAPPPPNADHSRAPAGARQRRLEQMLGHDPSKPAARRTEVGGRLNGADRLGGDAALAQPRTAQARERALRQIYFNRQHAQPFPARDTGRDAGLYDGHNERRAPADRVRPPPVARRAELDAPAPAPRAGNGGGPGGAAVLAAPRDGRWELAGPWRRPGGAGGAGAGLNETAAGAVPAALDAPLGDDAAPAGPAAGGRGPASTAGPALPAAGQGRPVAPAWIQIHDGHAGPAGGGLGGGPAAGRADLGRAAATDAAAAGDRGAGPAGLPGGLLRRNTREARARGHHQPLSLTRQRMNRTSTREPCGAATRTSSGFGWRTARRPSRRPRPHPPGEARAPAT